MAVGHKTVETGRPAARLYLVIEPARAAGSDAEDISRLLAAADIAAVLLRLEHDPEKLPDFSDKIMRQNKEIESALDSTRSDRALVHDPEKLPDFSDKIMRQNKEIESALDSTRSDRALAHDPEKLPDFSDKSMRENKEIESALDSTRSDRALAHDPEKLPDFSDKSMRENKDIGSGIDSGRSHRASAPASEHAMIDQIKRLAPAVQTPGAALIIEDHPDLVARAGADGAHLTGVAALIAAVPGLKPDRIAGAGGLRSRHDAMLAGEAGADYVMFGEPDVAGRRPSFETVIDRVRWWAELFEIPCVAYAADRDEIGPLCAAGADFVAIGEAILSDPRGAVAAVRDASQRLAEVEAPA